MRDAYHKELESLDQGVVAMGAMVEKAVHLATTAFVEDDKELAARVHRLLGCERVSRVDMVLGTDGVPYVLEVNTSPGMTETSLLPMAASAEGIDFQELVVHLVRATLKVRP